MTSRSINVRVLDPVLGPDDRFPCLAPLAPFGEGRGDIESLYSYLSRLVKQHSLPVRRLWKVLGAATASDRHGNARGVSVADVYLVSGIGGYARYCSNAVSRLTREVDARVMTFLALGEVVDPRGHGVLSSHVKWCPECWSEDKEVGVEGYLRLAWQSALVKVCPTHLAPLEERCPKCRRLQPSSIGLPIRRACNHCNAPLDGSRTRGRRKRGEPEREVWVARAVDSLIVAISRLGGSPFSAHAARGALGSVCEQLTDGSMNKLEKLLGFENKILQKWASADRTPTFHTLIELCYRLDLPPDQFLLYTDNIANPIDHRCLSKPTFARKRSRGARSSAEVGEKLRELLDNPWAGEPLLKDIAHKLGVTTSYLRYHFPDQVREIGRRRSDYRNAAEESRSRDRLSRVEDALRSAGSRGLYPSDRHLRMVSDLSIADLRDHEVKDRVAASKKPRKVGKKGC